MSFEFIDSGDYVSELKKNGLISGADPEALIIDNDEFLSPGDGWEKMRREFVSGELVQWDTGEFLSSELDGFVKLQRNGFNRDIDTVMKAISQLSLTLGVAVDAREDWPSDPDYDPPGFGYGHYSHGWLCFFKGEGHKRLASRRWLEYGPWRIVRGLRDTTVIQFYDPDASLNTALKQARPGHECMGVSDAGGFIHTDHELRFSLEGIYEPQERKHKIVVSGRSISKREMLDACAARLNQSFGSDRPVDNVAYVFVDEVDARKYLHELWLRELECWLIDGARQIRLDEDYTPPPPDKPQWVKDLEARDST